VAEIAAVDLLTGASEASQQPTSYVIPLTAVDAARDGCMATAITSTMMPTGQSSGGVASSDRLIPADVLSVSRVAYGGTPSAPLMGGFDSG
jgi:hypothetical protein